MLLIIATFVVESQRIILNGNLVEFFLSSISVLTTRLLHYKAPPDLSVSGRFTNPGQVDVFLYPVFPDNVHSDLHPPPFTSLSHVQLGPLWPKLDSLQPLGPTFGMLFIPLFA